MFELAIMLGGFVCGALAVLAGIWTEFITRNTGV